MDFVSLGTDDEMSRMRKTNRTCPETVVIASTSYWLYYKKVLGQNIYYPCHQSILKSVIISGKKGSYLLKSRMSFVPSAIYIYIYIYIFWTF